jgi:hypothetical protein
MEKDVFLVPVPHNKSETFRLIEKFQFSREPFRVILDNEPRLVVLGLILDFRFLIVRDAGRTGDRQLETRLAVQVLRIFQVKLNAFQVLGQ